MTTTAAASGRRPERPPTFGTSVMRSGSIRMMQSRNYSTSHDDSSSSSSYLSNLSRRIRENRNTTNPTTTTERNCPICDRFSQGPCGRLFQEWLACVDHHPGPDPSITSTITTKDKNNSPQAAPAPAEWHLRACAQRAQALAVCLDQHEAFYDKSIIHDDNNNITTNNDNNDSALPKDQEEKNSDGNDDDNDESDELKQAWERLIQEDLANIPRRPFPTISSNHKPIIEIRPKDRLGMIMFNMADIDHKQLLLVFVQQKLLDDNDNHNGDTSSSSPSLLLLSAGSRDDLYTYYQSNNNNNNSRLLSSTTTTTTEFGILQCTIPPNAKEIVVSALYEDIHDTTQQQQIIYTYTARVPPSL